MTGRTFPHRTHVLGPVFFGWCQQGAGAPVIDTASTTSADGWSAGSWVIRLRPSPGRAFQVGLKSRPFIPITSPRRLARLPLVGWLFRPRSNYRGAR